MLNNSPLGKDVQYKQAYAPNILFSIPRAKGRDAIGLPSPLPFTGVDIWTGYELSWLDLRGKPEIAVAEFRIPADSKFLVESKSFKLYLNSLNGTRFKSMSAVKDTIAQDISRAVDAPVAVRLISVDQFSIQTTELDGASIDNQDVEIDTYDMDPGHLKVHGEHVTESLRSHLLKSNCPVTGQPDWASVVIRYTGPRLDRAALLKYIVSFRDHTGFHEQCVEQIFVDLKERCKAEKLTVYARYTRRGGLDINPFRSDFEASPPNIRNFRQ